MEERDGKEGERWEETYKDLIDVKREHLEQLEERHGAERRILHARLRHALIVPFLPKGATIFEAAWGKGHMVRSLQTRGYKVVGSPDMNFLTAPVPVCDYIITNPPFSKKDEFLRRVYEIGKPWAFILPADSLFGLERYPLFSDYGLRLPGPESADSVPWQE